MKIYLIIGRTKKAAQQYRAALESTAKTTIGKGTWLFGGHQGIVLQVYYILINIMKYYQVNVDKMLMIGEVLILRTSPNPVGTILLLLQ